MWGISFALQRRVVSVSVRATTTTKTAANHYYCRIQPYSVILSLSQSGVLQKSVLHTTSMARKRAATVAAEPAEPKRRASARLRGSPAQAQTKTEDGTDTEVKKTVKEIKPADKAAPKKAAPKQAWAADDADNEDPDPCSLPDVNPEVERHDGEWYWLMKAEPESRFENGIDVKFSIDDLRARTKPEPWDGIRNYAARNNFKAMNHGDKAFFYHSNTKEPGIVGIMEIVKEYSEDVSARRPGTAYYDPQSTKDKPRWGLVHVRFVKKFAVQIGLPELRQLGSDGRLPDMQMLKQSRLSVSKVGQNEFKLLCELADKKAAAAGLAHIV